MPCINSAIAREEPDALRLPSGNLDMVVGVRVQLFKLDSLHDVGFQALMVAMD